MGHAEYRGAVPDNGRLCGGNGNDSDRCPTFLLLPLSQPFVACSVGAGTGDYDWNDRRSVCLDFRRRVAGRIWTDTPID